MQKFNRIFLSVVLCLLCFIQFLLCYWLCCYYDDGNKDQKLLDQFEWPPFIDVRAEVDKQLLGQAPSSFVINRWADFRTVIEPNCADWQWNGEAENSSSLPMLDKEILVLVKTAPDRTKQRAAIRASFGAFKGVDDYRLRTLFVMGSMLRWRTDWLNTTLEPEARQWGDMLVGEHEDDYFHSCYKLANAIKLARRFCGRPRAVAFVHLVDDDYVLFPWELVKLALNKTSHSSTVAAANLISRVYEGYCYFNAPAIRDKNDMFNKWLVTPREYPFSEYPPHCSGGTVFLSQRTIEEFYLAIQHLQFFVWEDVYTGILAHLLGIRPVHNPAFWAFPHSWEPYFMFCISTYWRNAPRCNNWRGVISAHGYSPEEIGQIYTDVHGRWQLLEEQQQQSAGKIL